MLPVKPDIQCHVLQACDSAVLVQKYHFVHQVRLHVADD